MDITLNTILNLNAKKLHNRDAFICDDYKETFLELNERAKQRAHALLSLGVKKGDHVATLFHNSLEIVECTFAILRIGAVLVPLNARLSAKEITHIINYADISTIIFQNQYEEVISHIKNDIKNVIYYLFVGNNCPKDFIDFEMLSGKQTTEEVKVVVKEEDVATILFTSGTTGTPKGVVATHRNWIWSMINSNILFKHRAKTKVMTIFPLFHAGGFFNLFLTIFSGFTLVTQSKFEPKKAIELIQREKINKLANPTTVYSLLLQVPEIKDTDLSSVEYLCFGAERMTDTTRTMLKKAFPCATIYNNYGMTETCAFVASPATECNSHKQNSVGVAAISLELRVVDDKGNNVGAEQVGEIIVRGPNIMIGYYKDPDRTNEAIRDGWLYTEDLGRYDDGFLYIIERKNNMIISGGENIYPQEVENILRSHPKVQEAAVFGLPDNIWGEKVCAAIELTHGENITEETLIAFCNEHLARYKKPKHIVFIDSLPRIH